MNKTSLWFAAAALSLAACGDVTTTTNSGSAAAKASGSAKPGDSAKVATTAAETGTAAGSAAAAPADVSPEMAAFLKDFDGTDKGVAAALKKVSKPGLDDKDMSIYTLGTPKVIKTDKKSDKQTCYDFEANAGMMIYTYGVCWEGGKIVAVEAKGSK